MFLLGSFLSQVLLPSCLFHRELSEKMTEICGFRESSVGVSRSHLAGLVSGRILRENWAPTQQSEISSASHGVRSIYTNLDLDISYIYKPCKPRPWKTELLNVLLVALELPEKMLNVTECVKLPEFLRPHCRASVLCSLARAIRGPKALGRYHARERLPCSPGTPTKPEKPKVIPSKIDRD